MSNEYTPGRLAILRGFPLDIVLEKDRHKPNGSSSDPMKDARDYAQVLASVRCDHAAYDHTEYPHRFTSARQPELIATARRLVLCWNFHDEIVAAMQEFVDQSERGAVLKLGPRVKFANILARIEDVTP